MHICVVTDVFYPIVQGDVIRILKDIFAIKETGHFVSIVSPCEGVKFLNCYRVKSHRISLISFPKIVFEIHKKHKIDILWVNRYFLILPLFILSRIIGAKFVCEIHGPERKQTEILSESRKKIIYDLIYSVDELLLRFVDKIIVVEMELKNWLVREIKVPKDKIIFIGNYPDLSIFKPSLRMDSEDFVVGYVGTLQENRINPLLDLVSKNKKGCRFIVIGEGEDKVKVKKFKQITHLVEKDYQKVPQHIKKFNLGIIFSLSPDIVFSEKGPPMKLFEYLACGVPVLAVNIPNLRPLIEGNGLGLVVEKDKLEEGVEIIKNNYSWYKNNVLKFRKTMKGNYSWENEKKKIAQILENFRR